MATSSSNKPAHIQRLEQALDLRPFMGEAERILNRAIDSDDDELNSSDYEKYLTYEQKSLMYNAENIGEDRKWLYDMLLSDTESESEISDEDTYVSEMLRDHIRDKKYRTKYHQNPINAQYGYYSSGLLSINDCHAEHKQSIVNKRRKKRFDKEPIKRGRKLHQLASSRVKLEKEDDSNLSGDLNDMIDWEDQIMNIKEEDTDYSRPQTPTGKGRKRKSFLNTPEMLNHRRRKVWQMMAKKEIGKLQRTKANNHKEMLTNCKKTAVLCQKAVRQKAMESQKRQKETIWRAKRLTREMMSYWKKFDRVERENRRRQEKEAEEQRKMDVELVEVKRQQRKLNFLITQTELYAHYMSHKGEQIEEDEALRILNQLDEEMPARLTAIDNYDSEVLKSKAQKNVEDALAAERERTAEFDRIARQTAALEPVVENNTGMANKELPQPSCFKGVLKGYQIKGMTWLASLYKKGISGILADEMGLGKTVQSIAFLCHVAENYGVWGPFLIISPASTLHNWQQEFARFVPEFKVVPYWGSPAQRKILRQFWEQKHLHKKEASFHVVITSYQLIVSDYKYFNRIKWHAMILDEAQAIKSTSSVRWKLLLQFNCRNRLLLSGTPIQNSMGELWALLHFIMPTLFDSHEEFNEWFSKDIESHAENKTGIDEKQISRLHMILKPFMLRRIKKDVENELSDKIEIMTYCPLTTRQKYLYMALKKKIRIEDLLKATGLLDGHTTDKNFTSNLMNLVMQFRKVCNHPELFERRDVKSPYSLPKLEYQMPRLIYNEGRLHKTIPSNKHLIYNKFSIFKAENIQRRLTDDCDERDGLSFLKFINLTPGEVEKITIGGILEFLLHVIETEVHNEILNYRQTNWNENDRRFLLLEPTFCRKLNKHFLPPSSILQNFLFTSRNVSKSTIYTHQNQLICSMQESADHRHIRSRHTKFFDNPTIKSPLKSPTRMLKSPLKSPTIKEEKKTSDSECTTLQIVPEFPHIPREPRKLLCEPTQMPKFLFNLAPKVQSHAKHLYVDSRAAAWEAKRFDHCDSKEGWELINEGIKQTYPHHGWSYIKIPDKQTLVSDAGKLTVLDSLLTRLKAGGHRVLIYTQMTKMIDLLEEYMWHRKHRYIRLDGSSKISARRDMVADFQNREDIFCFLLSTRAGGLGINLTAADTVIFYDSDWNPTVDQQAMDRAHRLGQTKQVTVYRLICKGTIEERILQRAREKSEIQRMVISGGNFKPDQLKPKEVVSLLLDDDEIETKYRQKKGEDKKFDDAASSILKEPIRKRKTFPLAKETKKQKLDLLLDAEDLAFLEAGIVPSSPAISEQSQGSKIANSSVNIDEDSSNEGLIVDEGPSTSKIYGDVKKKRHPSRAGNRRPGRPRGTGKKRDIPEGAQQQKRGPGRPKTKNQGGPQNQGFRNIQLQRSFLTSQQHHLPQPSDISSTSLEFEQII